MTSGLGGDVRGIIPAIGLVLLAPLALAQTTRTYTYDALGRLTKVSPGTGTPVCYAYDPADNRTSVSATAGCIAGTSPPPPPPPPPPNSAPTAVNDYFAIMVTAQPWSGVFPVLANDTDPNLPGDTLTITSVTGPGSANLTIAGGGSYLSWSGTANGSKHITYTIKDSGNLTSSAFLDIDFVYCPAGVCP